MLEAIIARNPTEKTYVEDVFSTTLYTGNGVSQDIINGINLGDDIIGPVANFGNNTAFSFPHSDNLILSGGEDFTYEVWIKTPRTANGMLFNKGGEGPVTNNIACVVAANGLIYLDINGNRAFTTDVDVVPANKWTHIAITRVFATVRCFVNGVLILTASASGKAESTLPFLIGAKDTSGFTPQFTGQMSNFRFVKGTALYTSNFTPSRTNLTAVSGTQLLTFTTTSLFTDSSTNNFTPTNTGVTSLTAITPLQEIGSGKGGLVWIKTRSAVTNHRLYDTFRGTEKDLNTNSTGVQGTDTGSLTAFSSSGFALGSGTNTNTNGATYASWTFRKAPKFFDIVTYTGTGSARTISHNLGSVPGMIIVKRLSGGAENWIVYNRNLTNTQYLVLNSTANPVVDATYWNSTTPTSTGFSVGTANAVNANGSPYIAYLFAHDAGGFGSSGAENVITCGTFTTNSGTATVNLGYEPQFIIAKEIDTGSGPWNMIDTMRGWNLTSSDLELRANSTQADATIEHGNPTSTGFVYTDANFANATHIYLAIRRGPMRTPTDATKVFKPVTTTGASPNTLLYNTGFPVDAFFEGWRDGNAVNSVNCSRLFGNYKYLVTSSTAAEASDGGYRAFDSNNGVLTKLTASLNSIGWNFRRAPGFFDVVCYKGPGAGNTFSHNLSAIPELIIIKNRTSASYYGWLVYSADLGYDKTLLLNTDGPAQPSSYYSTSMLSSTPTKTTFSLGGFGYDLGLSGDNVVAYLFASCPGVSKVGSYTGNGSSLNIDCGFTNGARFVLIKRTNSTGDWYVWDTARGIVAANDPHLSLNSTAAEVTTNDSIDPLSTGFTVNQVTATNINVNAATYIYLAIA